MTQIPNLAKAVGFAACAIGALLGASTASAAVYDAEYVFGDSLSDRGNIASFLFHQNFPYPPSNHDSFTNGPVAVERLAQSLGLNADPSLWLNGFTDPHNLFGGPSFVPGTNYAVGGATAAANPKGGFPGGIINLPDQVGAYSFYKGGVADPSALYVVMIGGNDVIHATLEGTGATAIADGVGAELAAISTLSGEGAKNFLIVNVPNVGLIPLVAHDPGLAATATADSQLYDTELAAGLTTLDSLLPAGTSLTDFDLYAYNAFLLAHAASLGFTDTTDPCFTSTPLSAAATMQCGIDGANISSFVYWDSVHPTGKVQALWAQAIGDAIGVNVAVPEPSTWAAMLIGFAGLGFAGFRRARKARAAPLAA